VTFALQPAAYWDYTPPQWAAGEASSEFNQTPLEGEVAPLVNVAGGAFTDQLPISEPTYPVSVGARQASWADDLLERIHVTPGSIDFANIVGNASRTINVWNAYAQSVTLTSIGATGAEGLTLSGQPAPPLTYSGYQDRDYTLTATTDGPPTVAASFVFNFSAGGSRTVTVAGRRVIAWWWRPTWDRGILERLEWKTDVLRSYNGREQRRKLRKGARRSVEFDVLISDADRRQLETTVGGWQARVWALPVWWSARTPTAPISLGATSIAISTANSDFAAGGLAIVLAPDGTNEVVEIDTVGASALNLRRPTASAWSTLAQVFPAIPARMDQAVALARFTGSAAYLRARFTGTEPADFTAATPATTFLGYPAITARPLMAGEIGLGMRRKVEEIDGDVGAIYVDDEAGLPLLDQSHGWLAVTEGEAAALRGLLYLLAGRFGAVWLPSFADDFTVRANIAAGAAAIDVVHTNYGRYLVGTPGRNHLAIFLRSGAVSLHKISGSVEVDATTERLTLSPTVASSIATSDILAVSFLSLVRLGSDAVEVQHWTGESIEVATSFASFRHDL